MGMAILQSGSRPRCRRCCCCVVQGESRDGAQRRDDAGWLAQQNDDCPTLLPLSLYLMEGQRSRFWGIDGGTGGGEMDSGTRPRVESSKSMADRERGGDNELVARFVAVRELRGGKRKGGKVGSGSNLSG